MWNFTVDKKVNNEKWHSVLWLWARLQMKWSATSGVAVVDVVVGCGTSCFPEWRLQCRRLTMLTTSWVSCKHCIRVYCVKVACELTCVLSSIHCIHVYWVKVACELTCILPVVLLTWAVYCVYQNLLYVHQALKNVCWGFFHMFVAGCLMSCRPNCCPDAVPAISQLTVEWC